MLRHSIVIGYFVIVIYCSTSNIVMKFERLVDLFHKMAHKAAEFADEAGFVHRAGLVDHDFGNGLLTARTGGQADFERIDTRYV